MKKRPVKVYPKNRRNLDIHINTHKLNTVMENNENMIVEKTTIVKNAEPLTLKAVPFAKGYKVEVKLSMNPENTMDMDKVLLPLESSKLRQAVAGFIQFIEDATDKGGLGGNFLTDDD